MANDHNETMKVATDAGVALVKTIKRNAELEAENARLSTRVERLESALKAVRDDLNIRAVKGVVAVGYSVWLQINRELEEGK